MDASVQAVAYAIGIVLSVPALVALGKAVYFIATATTKLEGVIKQLDDLIREMREDRHEKNERLQAVERRMTRIETRLGLDEP